jgi:hypothetical protein
MVLDTPQIMLRLALLGEISQLYRDEVDYTGFRKEAISDQAPPP